VNIMKSRLSRIVDYAYENVPFYMEQDNIESYIGNINNPEDMRSLPITSKDELISNNKEILSVKAITEYINKRLRVEHTSGSTGKCLTIYWNKNDYKKSMMELWLLRYKYYGIKPDDKVCYFFTTRELDLDSEKGLYEDDKSLAISKIYLVPEMFFELYEKIERFDPVWMILQPSTADILCDFIEKNNLMVFKNLKYIEFSGEILSDSLRKRVKEIFNVKIADQYGANEFNSIAYECPCGNMHIMESNVYVETCEPKNAEGELLITTLTNKTMPLIRYRVGDIGKIGHVDCKCGNKSPVITLMTGRANDFIKCEDGERLSSYVFVRAIDRVNIITNGKIKQFKVTQTNINVFRVDMVIDEEDTESVDDICSIFIDSVREKQLDNVEYEFYFHYELMKVTGGRKYKYFERNMVK